MTAAIESELIRILTELRKRPQSPDGKCIDDAEIAGLALDQIEVDSLAYLELMYRVEEKYDVVFGDISVDTFESIRDIAAEVHNKMTTG
jgi:acyl carrier protein